MIISSKNSNKIIASVSEATHFYPVVIARSVNDKATQFKYKATLLFWIASLTLAMTLSFKAIAQCTPEPTCDELGFSQTSVDCNGGLSLKCPFDNTKVFCQGSSSASGEVCVIGSILYSDKSCSSNLLVGKTAVGIVVDPSKKSAIALTQSQKPWNLSTSDTNYASVPGLDPTTGSPVAVLQFDGKSYTKKILAYNSNYQAAKYCNDMSASGTGFGAGNWYLPALGELNLIYTNREVLNTVLSKVSGAIPFNTTNITTDYYWSSSEYSSDRAWPQSFYGNSPKYRGKTANSFVRCVVNY